MGVRTLRCSVRDGCENACIKQKVASALVSLSKELGLRLFRFGTRHGMGIPFLPQSLRFILQPSEKKALF